MFAFSQLEIIQVEITNRCQASCPMCLRNIHGGIENPLLKLTDWNLFDFKEIFSKQVLTQIRLVEFCGVFGDPILNNDLIEMCRYLKENSNVAVQIKTNGSARSTSWWKSLAEALPTNHVVEFAIDGLENTHSLYRIGTDFSTILRNAQEFISAGGTAHWMFIKFKHNENEVDLARNLSNQIGFKSFTVKNSKRFGKQFPVLDRQGNVSYYIEPPSASNIRPVEFLDLKDYKQWNGGIDCYVLSNKEIYIDAHGHVFPCCLIASFLYTNYDKELYSKYNLVDNTSIITIAKEAQDNVFSLVLELGGLDMINTHLHSVKDIMDHEIWQELMHKKWANNLSAPCTILCSSESPFITIKEQTNRAS